VQSDAIALLTATRGGGKWIEIPDATPPVDFFTKDNICLSSGDINLYIYSTDNVGYWLVNSTPTRDYLGNKFPDSSFQVGLLVISQQQGKWMLAMYSAGGF
jgi:hypothetical protein